MRQIAEKSTNDWLALYNAHGEYHEDIANFFHAPKLFMNFMQAILQLTLPENENNFHLMNEAMKRALNLLEPALNSSSALIRSEDHADEIIYGSAGYLNLLL